MTRWKVSAKWLARRHECNLNGIRLRCGGSCCHSKVFWPPKSGRPDGSCERLGPEGCEFVEADRPVSCLLYPIRVNANGTMIVHHRATFSAGHCSGNHGHGPPIIEVLRSNLEELFGAEQWERVHADVMAGRDSYFDVPEAVAAGLEDDLYRTEENIPPEPRRLLPLIEPL